MVSCPACSAEVPDGSRYCSSCGAALETPTSAPTETSLKGPPTATSRPSLDMARFIPGAVLAKRYRIISLLGRGGMGEVYRADDLKLGQSVALKFLPERVARDEARLARFLNEVKVALKVTHPNVCRVYDVGDVDGQHYIAMEYVDGEDLASLLRRIGRLPKDKAVQIARQLCAGLAAAHEEGILHRDLKPANVMIDGRGRAKITDFGLASLAGSIRGDEARAGTPLYMAPEQIAGREVTARSDLYALGLVLYELFTGKRAFDAATPAEMLRLEQESQPTSPARHVEGMDPAVERAILRCLEREPASRPSSALAIAASLPGGDPLAAALAAGETPSPEMVAAAGGTGALKPAVAVALLLVTIVALPATSVLIAKHSLTGRVRLDVPPEALVVEARETLERTGSASPSKDSGSWFVVDGDYIRWDEKPAGHENAIRPPPIHFRYQQAPSYLTAGDLKFDPGDPPTEPGSATVTLNPSGHLLRFRIVTPERDLTTGTVAEPDWSVYFDRAGLDIESFRPVRSEWNPLLDCDHRDAWIGAYAGQPEIPIRVEAGSYRGTPVYFEVIPPWREPRRSSDLDPVANLSTGARVPDGFYLVMAIVWIIGLPFALRNLRQGRGDRRGAVRFSLCVFVMMALALVLIQHHAPAIGEVRNLIALLVGVAPWAVTTLIAYMALEPVVRRLWPQTLISASRLLAGRFRDPLVGRDILIGGALQVVTNSLFVATALLLPAWLDRTVEPQVTSLVFLSGPRQTFGVSLLNAALSVWAPIVTLLVLLFLRVALRRTWIAWMTALALGAVPIGVLASDPFHATALCLWFALQLIVLVRYGLLPVIFAGAFSVWEVVGLTLDSASWFFGRSLLVILLLVALASYGFRISLGGRPLFLEGREVASR